VRLPVTDGSAIGVGRSWWA